MTIENLQRLVNTLLRKTTQLKKTYIPESLGAVDYIGIFPVNDAQRKEYCSLLETLEAKVIYSDDDGPLYLLPHPIQTNTGAVRLIKICKVDSIYNPKRNKIGYADYQTSDYQLLKNKYGKHPAFTFIYGKVWEILCLQNPDENVSVYIPNIPLSKDLGL